MILVFIRGLLDCDSRRRALMRLVERRIIVTNVAPLVVLGQLFWIIGYMDSVSC